MSGSVRVATILATVLKNQTGKQKKNKFWSDILLKIS